MMEPTLTADQMRAIAQQAGAPYQPLAQNPMQHLTPEMMHEQFHAANGGLGHAEVAAMQPQAAPTDLAPPLETAPPTDVAPGLPAPAAGDPISALAANGLATAEVDKAQAKEKLYGNINKMDAGFAAENKANAELRDVAAAQSQALDAVEAEKTRIAKQNEEQMAAISQKGQIAAQRQMVRLNAAADEAATAEVHSFWQDKSTGARILGILSQAFAGAANGLANNPGAVTPLDRVIQDDLARQQMNLAQKNRKVGEARGVLNDIFQATGSQQQAQTAMYIAAWKRVEQQANEVKNKFGTPQAQAQFDQVSALAQQRQASAKDKVLTNLYNNAVQDEHFNLQTLQQQQAVGAEKPLTGENERIFTLAGTTGEVDNRTYDKFKTEDQAYRAVNVQQKAIKQIFAKMAAGKLNPVQGFADYTTARADLLSSMRKMQGTGAALSDQELKNVEALLPNFATAEAPGVGEFFNKTGAQQIARIAAVTGRRYFSLVNKTIKGVHLNPNDPDYGNDIRTFLNEKAEQQAQQ